MLNIKKLSKWTLFLSIIISLVSDSATINRAASLIMIVVCSANLFLVHHGKIKNSSALIGLFLYGIILIISCGYTIAPSGRAISVTISYFLSFFYAVFVIDNIEDVKDIDYFLHSILIASIVQLVYMLSIYGINIFRVIQQSENSIRIGDQTSNSNTVGMLFAYGAIISTFFFLKANREHTVRGRVIYLVASISLSAISLLSGSRKGLVVLIAGMILIILFTGNENKIGSKLKTLIIAVIVAVGLYFAISTLPVFSTVYIRMLNLINGLNGSSMLDYSSRERLRMIEEGLRVFSEHPILGQGVYASYHYFGSYSHNNFVEVLMNTGIVGFVVYYFPYLQYTFRLLKCDKNDKRYWLITFFFLWIFLGGYGMVTYYEKITMILVALTAQWYTLNEVKNIVVEDK